MDGVQDSVELEAAHPFFLELGKLRREIVNLRDEVADVRRQAVAATAEARAASADVRNLSATVQHLDAIITWLGGDERIKVDRDAKGFITLRYRSPYIEGFEVSLTGTVARVRRGSLILPGIGAWESDVDSEKDYKTVTVSGASPAWIYATHPRVHTDSGLTVEANTISTYPRSNATQYALPLWELRNDGSKWYVHRKCLGGADIVLGSPT